MQWLLDSEWFADCGIKIYPCEFLNKTCTQMKCFILINLYLNFQITRIIGE